MERAPGSSSMLGKSSTWRSTSNFADDKPAAVMAAPPKRDAAFAMRSDTWCEMRRAAANEKSCAPVVLDATMSCTSCSTLDNSSSAAMIASTLLIVSTVASSDL